MKNIFTLHLMHVDLDYEYILKDDSFSVKRILNAAANKKFRSRSACAECAD